MKVSSFEIRPIMVLSYFCLGDILLKSERESNVVVVQNITQQILKLNENIRKCNVSANRTLLPYTQHLQYKCIKFNNFTFKAR